MECLRIADQSADREIGVPGRGRMKLPGERVPLPTHLFHKRLSRKGLVGGGRKNIESKGVRTPKEEIGMSNGFARECPSPTPYFWNDMIRKSLRGGGLQTICE